MSRAIPIINPDSGDRRPIPSAQIPDSTSTALPLHLRNNTLSGAAGMPNMLLDDKTGPASKLQQSSGSEAVSPFNVYARAFVPEALTVINTLNGHRIDTPAANQFEFGAYVRSYIGSEFLTTIPQPTDLPVDVSFVPTNEVLDTYYEQHFRYHLNAEIQSQEQENQSYSLYGYDVNIVSCESGQPATLSLVVPGLREESPYIEEDDIIQLRQLRYDHMGKVLGMEQWLHWRNPPAPGWTGIIYNARVSSVHRKEETLFIKVFGFPPQDRTLALQHARSGMHYSKFNVQFPVPLLRYLPMQQVLPIIQNALTQANSSISQYEDTWGVPDADLAEFLESYNPRILGGHHWLKSMLSPSAAHSEMQRKLNAGSFKRPFFDEELNWEQKKAIESICSQDYGTLPFLISGPPGTGKTKTLIEVALQLIRNVEKVSHILICAPSDPAADTLVQRLKPHLGHTELLRLNRPSRTFAEVSGVVLPFCYVSENKFSLPPFKILMSYRIVITTCSDASLLMYSRMTNSDLYAAEYGLRDYIHPHDSQQLPVELHWTALLIDEAAQAIEPEALIPLLVVAPPLKSIKFAFKPIFVMAGDENQLGPRTSLSSSPLKTSLFARLFARPFYADHPLARGKMGKLPPALKGNMLPIFRPAFSNLIQNYRSHPAILAVPSALFYADTLEPKAIDIDRLVSWTGWRGRRWPVLFHSNNSEDELEQDGGGWYNIGEAQAACRYAANLVLTGLVEQKEVCIMSPFKAQVKLIRKIIREQHLWNVDVGPTEIFQGLERGVVILCTTRSKQRFVKSDMARNWGIIGMPKQMNVALTRAKYGLVVIGKRETLVEDANWKEFLDFCDRNGLVTDVGYNGKSETTRLERVLLTKSKVEKSRVIKGVGQDDEMWENGMQDYEYEEEE